MSVALVLTIALNIMSCRGLFSITYNYRLGNLVYSTPTAYHSILSAFG